MRFGVVAARFNEDVTSRLLEGAVACLESHGATADEIEIYRVPGAFELPATVRRLLDDGRFDAVVAIGALIRGETPHFEYIATQTCQGLSQVSVETGIPVAFGVITCDTMDQARARSSKGRNKGWEAALAAIEMADLFRKIESRDSDAPGRMQ